MDEVRTTYLLRKVFIIVLLVLLSFLLFTVNHKFVVVTGVSMEPTLRDGDIVRSSVATMFTSGDVYLLQEPEGNKFVIKRLVGTPGDTVEFRDGALYRNGILVEEAHGDSWDNALFELGNDEYLFVGDNRGESYDGRNWSRFVNSSEIKYHLDYIMYPINHKGKVG